MSINFIIAQIFGLTALAVLIISFQQNNKNKLLKYQTYSSLLYAIQYIFLGALTGCLMNLSCMARNYIFEKYKAKRPPIYYLILVLILMITVSALSFNGFISLLPMLAVILYSVAVWIGNLTMIRIVEVISCTLYILYNIEVRAYTGLIATIIEMVGAIIALYKFNIKNHS